MAAPPAVAVRQRTGSELREWVTSFYEAHNPEKLGSVDAILGKYEGKEEELVSQLERKYCAKPSDGDKLLLESERRAKEEAVRRLGECSKQFAELQERVVLAERRAATSAAESAASSSAAAAKHRLLLRTLEENRDLQAHLSIALDRLGAAAVVRETTTGNDDGVASSSFFSEGEGRVETLYRSARAELLACGRDRHLARERVVEVSKRCQILEDEVARLKKSLESASNSERAIEAAMAQTRAAVENEKLCRADLAAEIAKNHETAARARDLEARLDQCLRAKAMLEEHYHERRREVEARALEYVRTQENRYRMLRADVCSRALVVDDLSAAAADRRLAAALGDRDRYARIVADLTRERDSLKHDVDSLKAELRTAAQRILQAENLVSSRQHVKQQQLVPPQDDAAATASNQTASKQATSVPPKNTRD